MKILQITLICTTILSSGKCAKSEDEGRPYEFGFTIDGQQHRYEKKGVNGIIQGEFGFITADGIYHVTMYATDENGAFRILSMRNVRISDPLDGSGGTYSNKVPASAVQGAGKVNKPAANVVPTNEKLQIQKQPSPAIPTPTVKPIIRPVVPSTTRKMPYIFTTQPTIKPACASCGYVTRPPPTQKPVIQTTIPNISSNEINHPVQNQILGIPTPGITQQQYADNPSYQVNDENRQEPVVPNKPPHTLSSFAKPQSASISNRPLQTVFSNTESQPIPPNKPSQSLPQPPSINIEPPAINGQYNQPQAQQPISQNLPTYSELKPPSNNQAEQNVEVFNPISASTPSSQNIQSGAIQPPVNTFAGLPVNNQPDVEARVPHTLSTPSLADRVKIENGAILVPNNPPIKIQDKYPGMVDGLPNGIEEKDITNILYKFNYTIGFHGHYEKGLKNGTKIGGYFVNGRDGISRIVTYVADELGYRPSFRLINLGLDSPLTPKEETEKTFGLKNFEFVWYPLN